MKRVMALPLLMVVVAGCSTAPAVAGVAQPATTVTGSPRATVPPVRTAEDRYWADLMDTPGMSNTLPRESLVDLGRTVCQAAEQGYARDGIVTALLSKRPDGSQPISGAPVANVLIDAALLNLCPGQPLATAPPKPAGPATEITMDATYEVGVDIVAGKWKADNGQPNCYWVRLRQGGDRNIIANDFPGVKATVEVKNGELFQVARCGTWRHVS